MFDNLTDRLGSTLKNLKGQGKLTESNVKDALREVRMALLEHCSQSAFPGLLNF
jgi:signal recognition particle subunit SRP54